MNDSVLPGFIQPDPEEVREPTAKEIDDLKQVRYQKYRGAMLKCLVLDCTRSVTYVRKQGSTVTFICTRHKQEQWDADYLDGLVR